jgi:uncharacterized membrane protein
MTGPAGDSAAGPARSGDRLLGVDAARCIALLGMMATHLIPWRAADGEVTLAYTLAEGRASALFAVIAGTSLALADGGHRTPPSPYGVMLGRVAVRAALIAFVGFLLAELDTTIFIILPYYALVFVLVAPFVRLPATALAVLGVGWAIVGPVASHVIRDVRALPATPGSPTLTALAADPGQLLVQLLLTGTYPAGTWLAYALVGAALGRAVLSARAWAVVAAAGFFVAAVVPVVSDAILARGTPLPSVAVLPDGTEMIVDPGGPSPFQLDRRLFGTTPTDSWWWLAADARHSGTSLDLLATIGSSVLVIGLMMIVVRGGAAAAFVWLTAPGSMTLTLYSLHVLMVDWQTGGRGLSAWILQATIVVLAGLAWRTVAHRGPLEWVVARVVDLLFPRRAAVVGRSR